MYAVIDLKWHQWIIKKGDEISVDRVDWKIGSTIKISDVLATFDEWAKDVKVGKPYIKATVKLKVKEHFLWEKMHVRNFKNKIRHNRNTKWKWFRAHKTVLSVESIDL